MQAEDQNDIADRIAASRQEFVESAWKSVALLSAVSAFALLLRTLTYPVWTRSTTLGMGILATILVAFFFRHRLGLAIRTAFPILVLILAADAVMLGSGLQGNGLAYLVVVNTLIAMLFGRRVILATMGLSVLVVVVAAVGFVSGRFPVRFDLDYAAGPMAWLIAIIGVFSLSLVVIGGIRAQRHSLQLLMERVAAQRNEIAQLANYDALTRLPLIRMARDRLQMACFDAARKDRYVALLFINLDSFKTANDTFGHGAGDQVLKTVATRLTESVRSVDTVARLGGDEFIIILNGVADADEATQTAARIVATIEKPIYYGDAPMSIGASVGISFAAGRGASPEDLLRCADQAMDSVKKSGKSGYAMHATATASSST